MLFSFYFIVCLLLGNGLFVYNASAASETAPESGSNGNNDVDDDYFYDDKLSKEEIDSLKKNRQLEWQRAAESASTTTEPTPEWFNRNESENSEMQKYMEEQIKEYLKKYQKEQMEKMKLKKKSDLNHPLLSVITLSVFFGSGIVIGLVIVLVKGNNFKNTSITKRASSKQQQKKKSLDKTAYKSVAQNEQIII
jgi:hypothetical protein